MRIEKCDDGSYIAYNVGGRDQIIGTGRTVSEAKDDYLATLRLTQVNNAENGYADDPALAAPPEFQEAT